MPQKLTDAEREAIEALASASRRALAREPTWECDAMACDRPEPPVGSSAVYVISVAAELAGVHPQTLRIYERKGLVDPARTGGGSRRYSERDIERLRRIQELTNAGLNLEGVRRVLELEDEVVRLRSGSWPGREQEAGERGRADPPAVPPRPGARSTARRCRWRRRLAAPTGYRLAKT